MNGRTHVYVAYARCGCVAAAVIDDPEYPADTASEVGRFIADGHRVERHALPFEMGGDCFHSPKWGHEARAER